MAALHHNESAVQVAGVDFHDLGGGDAVVEQAGAGDSVLFPVLSGLLRVQVSLDLDGNSFLVGAEEAGCRGERDTVVDAIVRFRDVELSGSANDEPALALVHHDLREHLLQIAPADAAPRVADVDRQLAPGDLHSEDVQQVPDDRRRLHVLCVGLVDDPPQDFLRAGLDGQGGRPIHIALLVFQSDHLADQDTADVPLVAGVQNHGIVLLDAVAGIGGEVCHSHGGHWGLVAVLKGNVEREVHPVQVVLVAPDDQRGRPDPKGHITPPSFRGGRVSHPSRSSPM